MIIFLLGLVDGMEVKGFVKLPYHTANILMGEPPPSAFVPR